MKIAIVYYSMSGNTEYAANKIKSEFSEETTVDIIRIHPQKAYPSEGARKFIWGGKSAVMGETPALMPYEFHAENYDKIIIGTPVWASTFAPPIKSFLKENKNIGEKPLAVFTCFSGGGADKAIAKLKKYVGAEKFEAELILVNPKDNAKDADNASIAQFCAKLK